MLEPNPIMSKPKELRPATTTVSNKGPSLYENAFLSFLSNQLKQEPAKKDPAKSYSRKLNPIKPHSKVEVISVPPKMLLTQAVFSKSTSSLPTDIEIKPTTTKNAAFISTTSSPYVAGNVNAPINAISPNLPKNIKISSVSTRDVNNSTISPSASRDVRFPSNCQASQAPPRDFRMYSNPSKQPQFSAPFAAAFDSMHTITNVEKCPQINYRNATQQMPQLSIPAPKDPHIEHEQMPMLDPHSPVTQSTIRQVVAPHVSFTNTVGQPSAATTTVPIANSAPMVNQSVLNVYSIKTVQPVNGMEKIEQPVLCTSNPQHVPPSPAIVKQHKQNLIWSNHKYYTVNQCPETTYLNNDRFYPMTQAPIKLGNVEKKVVVEAIPSDVNEDITALKSEHFGGINKSKNLEGEIKTTGNMKYQNNGSSSSSSSSSDSESDSETEDCKLQLSSDETSCYSPDGSDLSDSSSDEDDYKPNTRITEPEIKHKDRLPETIKSTFETKEETYAPENFNQYVADEKENVDSGQKKRPLEGVNRPAKKRGRKPKFFKAEIFKNKGIDVLCKGRKGKKPTKKVGSHARIRPYLSEIILGVRKKGRPNKNVQHKFTAIRNIINNFKDRFNFKPAKGPQSTDPNAPLSKYLAYKKASLTPLDCCVEVPDVLCHFSKDFQEYLKSGLTLFNVSSIPIAQTHPTSDSSLKEAESEGSSKQEKKVPNKTVSVK